MVIPSDPPEVNKDHSLVEVLDHGFVRLVDVMGDDKAIVQAARVSYGDGVKTVSEDRGLIRYLMRKRHTSPFEMAEFKFHVKMPIFVARQWARHRTASMNEVSARYSVMKDEFYQPNEARSQSTKNKQGSEAGPADLDSWFNGRTSWISEVAFEAYSAFIKAGISRELARVILPLNLYTEFYWKIDLHNLLHFLHLRMDEHAQEEIRVFADAIAGIVKERFPLAWDAFEDYVLYAHTFSRQEMEIIKRYMGMVGNDPNAWARDLHDLITEGAISKREADEFTEVMR